MSLAPEAAENAGEASVGTRRHVRLIVVLVVLMAAIALNQVVGGLWLPYHDRSPNIGADALFYAQHGAAYLCAGLLLDTFGLRRVVGLALIGWCSLIMLSGAAGGPSGIGGVHLLVILVFGVIHVAPHAAVKRGTRSGENALALVIPLVASYVWLAGIPAVRSFEARSRPLDADLATSWTSFALFGATAASFITMVWLVLYSGPDDSSLDRPGPDDRARRSAFDQVPILLADRRVWKLLLLWTLTTICISVGEQRLYRFLEVERQVTERTVGMAIYYPYLAAILAALVAAGWSDRIYRRTGSLASARRPFAVAAFALSAALGLVPLVRYDDVIAMSSIAAAGIGAQLIVDVIVIDVAPARYVGTLVGLLAAFDSVVRFVLGELALVLYRPARSFVPILIVGAIAGILGAVAAHRLLRRVEPIRDAGADRDIPAIFS